MTMDIFMSDSIPSPRELTRSSSSAIFSFAHLPTELKTLIVSWLDTSRDGAGADRQTLAALALTSRELSRLAAPVLWRVRRLSNLLETC